MTARTSTRGVVSLRLRRRLSAEGIEELADHVGDQSVELKLHDLDRRLAASEGRLLGLLARVRRNERNELTLRIHTGTSSPGLRDDSKYWQTLAETLVGVVLMTHATSVLTQNGDSVGGPLSTKLREVLQEYQGMLVPSARLASSGGRFSAIAIEGPSRTPLPELFGYLQPESAVSFRQELNDLISAHCHVPRLSSIGAVADFVRETLENAAQHGTTLFRSRPYESVRYLYVRNHHVDPQKSELLSANKGAAIDSYIRGFSEIYGHRTPLLEISVVDDGLGIAAQMLNGDMSIYHGSIEEEADVVRHALTREGTSRTDPDAGAGLDTALQGCKELKGLFTIRTGRCFFSRDFLQDQNSLVSVVNRRSDRELALLGGTSVSVLFPWAEPDLFQ